MTSGGGAGGSGSGGSAATVWVDVQARLDRLEADLKRAEGTAASSGDQAGNAFSKGFGKSVDVIAGLAKGAALAAGAAFIGIGAFIADGFKGVTEGQDAVAQLEAVITSTGNAAGVNSQALQDYAASIQETTKFNAEMVSGAQSILLTFTNIGAAGGVFDQATKTALDMAQALGGDAAGQSIALGKALNDPIAGVGALSKVGVTFTEEQKKVIKSLTETGDIAGAQKIILAELNKEFGGSAEAAGKTFTGQMERAKNALGEVGESIAVRALPLVQDLLDAFIDNMPQIQAVVDRAVTGVGQGFDFLKTNVFPVLQQAFETVKPVALSLFATLKDGFEQGKSVASEFGPKINSVLGAVIPIARDLGTAFTSAFNIVADVWEGVLKPTFVAIAPVVTPILRSVGALVGEVAGFIKAGFLVAQEAVSEYLIPAFQAITPVVKPVLEFLGTQIRVTIDVVTGIFKTAGKLLSGDWSGAWNTLKNTVINAGEGLENAMKTLLPKLVEGGKTLGTSILNGLKSTISGLGAVVLNLIANLLDSIADRVPFALAGMVTKAAQAARDASKAAEQVAAEARAPAGPQPYTGIGPRQNETPRTGPDPQESGKFGLAFIGSLADVFKNDPRVASDCGTIAYAVLDKLGTKIKGTQIQNANAGVLEKNAIASGFERVEGDEIKAGDLLVWTSGNGKKYGAVSGKHVGVAAGKDSKGNLQVINNPGSSDTVVEPVFDRQNLVAYRAPTSPFAAPVTQTPKTGTPANAATQPPAAASLPKVADTSEEVRKRVEAQIEDILARVDLKLISKEAAIKLLSAVDDEASAVAKKQGKGWQDYAATAKQAESAIDALSKSAKTGAAASKDVLGALQTQFEYAGKKGLPDYVKGLEAFISQQEKAVASSKAGSQAQLDAQKSVVQARQALATATNTTDKDAEARAKTRAANRLAAERALADGSRELARTRAQQVIANYELEVRAAGDSVAKKLLVEQRLGKDVLAARNVISAANSKDEVARLERERNVAVNVTGLGLKDRQALYTQFTNKIKLEESGLQLELRANETTSAAVRAGLQKTVLGQATAAASTQAQAVRKIEQLKAQAQRDAEIHIFQDLNRLRKTRLAEEAADSAYTTAGQERDRQTALNGEIALAGDLLRIKKANTAEALALDAEIIASNAAESAAGIAAIKSNADAARAEADDAANNFEALDTILRRLLAQGLDPKTSGYVQLLNDLILKGGQAGKAAELALAKLNDLGSPARLTNSTPAVPQGPDSPALPTRREAPAAPDTVAERGTFVPVDQGTEAPPRESLDRQIEFADNLRRIALEQAKAALTSKDLTDAQLAANLATAEANNDTTAYTLILDAQKQRATDAATNTDTLTQARLKLAEAQGEGAGPFQADITALEALRGKPGVVAAELDKLIAAYTELDAKKGGAAKLEQGINKFAAYAQQAIPGIVAGIEVLGGASDEVAGQWGADLGNMVNDVANFATAIAKGDYVGAAIQALTSIFTFFSRQAKAFKAELKATNDFNNQFAFDAKGYGTRVSEQYTTGILFWQSTHFKETIDEYGKALALSLEGGYTNGFENGFQKAVALDDFSILEKSITESVGKGALAGLLKAFLNEQIFKDILGPRIAAAIAASKTPGKEDDIAAAIGLREGGALAAAASKDFYDNVYKPIAEGFGLVGTDKPKDNPADTSSGTGSTLQPISSTTANGSTPTPINASATITQTIDLSALTTLSSAISTYVPVLAQAAELHMEAARMQRDAAQTRTNWANNNRQ